MDRLISEKEIFKILDNLKANFTCYDSVTLDEVYSHVKAIPSAEPCEDAISRDFQIGDEVRMIGSDPIYDDCDVGWVIRNASERIKTMYVMRNDGSADEESKAEWYKTGRHNAMLAEVIKALPSVKPQYTDDEIQKVQDLEQAELQKAYELGKAETEQFAKWVATEIFDDMWEYNKDAFAEIACRKLAKLGIVRAKGDEWELSSVTPQQEDIAKDGTLTVKVADGRKVTRVLVCGDNHFGGLYYPDEDAEPKVGYWIDKGSLSCRCDQCGCKNNRETKFCPNCGCRMVKPQESEVRDDKKMFSLRKSF